MLRPSSALALVLLGATTPSRVLAHQNDIRYYPQSCTYGTSDSGNCGKTPIKLTLDNPLVSREFFPRAIDHDPGLKSIHRLLVDYGAIVSGFPNFQVDKYDGAYVEVEVTYSEGLS